MKNRALPALAIAAALALGLAGCSAQGPSDGASVGTGPSASAVDAAKAEIQPIIDAPTAFPVTETLTRIPTGSRIAYVDCGTPICSLMADLAEEPAGLLGMTVTDIQAGTTADSVASAFDTIIADHYDAVMVTALPFQLWQQQFAQLQQAGIPIVTTGVTGLPSDFDGDLSGEVWNAQAGKWLADWVVSQGAPAAQTVIYRTPELDFTSELVTAYQTEVTALCPECQVRTIDIPAAAIGSTAPTNIVDDLTAHPDTTLAVLSIGEQATGLPAAMKVAGITTPVTMYGPGPAQLTDIESGSLQSGLSLDSRALVWMLIDSLARQLVGQPVSAGEADDRPIVQIVTKDNLSGDQSQGWIGYPDMADRFKRLWQVG